MKSRDKLQSPKQQIPKKEERAVPGGRVRRTGKVDQETIIAVEKTLAKNRKAIEELARR